MTTSHESASSNRDYAEHLDNAVGHAIEEALKGYLTSGVADRDALTRLQDRIHHIILLADKVPDALKATHDAHQENQRATADATKTQAAPQPRSEPNQPKSPQQAQASR